MIVATDLRTEPKRASPARVASPPRLPPCVGPTAGCFFPRCIESAPRGQTRLWLPSHGKCELSGAAYEDAGIRQCPATIRALPPRKAFQRMRHARSAWLIGDGAGGGRVNRSVRDHGAERSRDRAQSFNETTSNFRRSSSLPCDRCAGRARPCGVVRWLHRYARKRRHARRWRAGCPPRG